MIYIPEVKGERFAEWYRRTVLAMPDRPPPCVHCFDYQIEICADTGATCKKFDKYDMRHKHGRSYGNK